MTLRQEEREAIQDLLTLLSHQRDTTFTGTDELEPPDWVGIDNTTGLTIAIEHTRIVPRDLASIDRWRELSDAVYMRAAGVVSGAFLMGQVLLDQRFPTRKKVPVDPIAKRIVDAVARRQWSSNEAWEVSPTAAPNPTYHVRIMLVAQEGSEIVGLPPFGHRHPHEVIMRFRDAVEKKTIDLHTKASHVGEHVLLVDATAVHAAKLGSYVAHLVDVMETLRLQRLPVPTAIYFREADATNKIQMRRIWP